MTDPLALLSPTGEGRYARVNRSWEGETAVIIGGGPSLTAAQAEKCRGLRCIAVNDAYLLTPWADAIYFADSRWWGWMQNGRDGKGFPALALSPAELTARYRSFAGLKISISNAEPVVREPGVLFLKNHNEAGKAGDAFSQDPGMIKTGSNSCYQALNIAILAGAKRIIFLGLDGKSSGKKHWFGDHPDGSEAPYASMREQFRNAARWCAEHGITVLNCSPGSAIDCFPLMALEDALAGAPAPEARPIPAAPVSGQPSVYVRVSELLRSRDGVSGDELARTFPAGLTAALRKGLTKGTMVEKNGVYRRAESLVADTRSAVV